MFLTFICKLLSFFIPVSLDPLPVRLLYSVLLSSIAGKSLFSFCDTTFLDFLFSLYLCVNSLAFQVADTSIMFSSLPPADVVLCPILLLLSDIPLVFMKVCLIYFSCFLMFNFLKFLCLL